LYLPLDSNEAVRNAVKAGPFANTSRVLLQLMIVRSNFNFLPQ